MSAWIVYSKDGSIERCKLRRLEYGGTAMGERAVTATFDYHSEVAFEVFDYIEYRGERFELEAVPTVKKLSSFEYQYELRFVSLKYELERCEMRDLVPSDSGVVYPTPLTFSFTGDVRYLTDRIQACLDAMYGAGVWKIIIANGTSSEEKNLTIAQQNCWNALALVNSTYGLNFYIKGRTITIGGEQPLVSHTFEYGKGNGLYEIERASDTETGIVTKLRAYGSTRNLDYSYPKKPEWSDSVLPVSFALSPLRLMLPSFKADGKTDYVLADDAAIAKYGIREASMVYDDIYPSITGATYNGQAIDEIKAVDAVDESKKTFVVYLHELGFDLEEHLTTSDAQISMKSGALQGYTFTISSIEKQTGGYKITLGKNSLENSEESGAYVPGVNWNMKAGDKFVLLNILMPQKYIRDAENRLLARANEYLAQYSKTNFSYNIGLHDKFLIQNPSVYDSLIEGSKLKVYDKEIGIDEEVTIQSISITENLEDNILPQVKVTLNNEPSASTLDRIQGKLNEVAAESAANGFSTQSEIMAQYRKKLDKPFFDKLFVAIDVNGNEIPSTDVITPIAYIKAKYHVASVGGFTMYAMDKDVDIPSLASGLPFDGRTIWYNPDTNQIEVIGGTGGGSGEGVSNFWDLRGIPSWITISKPKYTYSEIEGTPDLSDYVTQNWIISQGYASAEELKKYIPISGYTEVSGEKNFTGGLKVNGSPIYYDTEKKYWKLEGDLLVTGGVTMYGVDSTDIPSLINSLPVASTKEKGVAYFDPDFFSVSSDGKVSFIGETGGGLDITALQNYLTQNSYLNVTEGDNRYLKLSGGVVKGVTTINGNSKTSAPLEIETPEMNYNGYIKFASSGTTNGYLGMGGIDKPVFRSSAEINYTLWHSGNFTPSDYLSLSGGTLSNTLRIDKATYSHLVLNATDSTNGQPAIAFAIGNEVKGYIGYSPNIGTYLYTKDKQYYLGIKDDGNIHYTKGTIWHSGNDGADSGLNADLLDGLNSVDFSRSFVDIGANNYKGNGLGYTYSTAAHGGACPGGFISFGDTAMYGCQINGDFGGKALYFRGINEGSFTSWKQIAFTDSNVASATKLQTPRTIWGNSFDGTSDVYGTISDTYGILPSKDSTYDIGSSSNQYRYVYASWFGAKTGGGLYLGANNGNHLYINTNGNVTIGSSNLAGTSYKLYVSGNLLATGGIATNDSVTINGIRLSKSKDGVLYLDGNLVVKGGVTMYGTDATSSPSILNSLPIASTKEKGVAYFDSEFFSVGSDGKVSFIGKTDGFNATELQNYLTQNSYLNTSSGDNRYLKLSGGELDGSLTINNGVDLTLKAGATNQNDSGDLVFANYNGEEIGRIWNNNGVFCLRYSSSDSSKVIIHNENYSQYALPLSGGTLTGVLTVNSNLGIGGYIINRGHYLFARDNADADWIVTNKNWGAEYALIHSGNIGSYNAGSANNLKTPRTIWGQSFDGTGNVTGSLSDVGSISMNGSIAGVSAIFNNTTNGFYIGGRSSVGATDGGALIYTYGSTPISFYAGAERMTILSNGNVGIGTKSPSCKLDVNGDIATSQYLIVRAWSGYGSGSCNMWYDGNKNQLFVNTGASFSYNCEISGTFTVNGATYLHGDVFVEELNTYDVIPRTSSTYDLGNSSYKWNNVYASSMITGYIHGGGSALYLGNSDNSSYIYIREDMKASSESWSLTTSGTMSLSGDLTSGSYGSNCVAKFQGIGSGNGYYSVVELITNNEVTISYSNNSRYSDSRRWSVGRASSNSNYRFNFWNASYNGAVSYIDLNGNFWVAGGITMYSDRRKKTILRDVELSLKEVANAPLIEHYYNSDDKKTIHVGSIAQYWAGLNDWFCKLDNEGYYTMEVQNAALASAISVARELDRYETKTDKQIKKLKKRICELEEEVERLKSA